MSTSMSRGKGRRPAGDSSTQRTCPLSTCGVPIQDERFTYCSKEHSRQAVINGEAEPCIRCKLFPKNPPHEYCTRLCGTLGAAGLPYDPNPPSSLTMTYVSFSMGNSSYGGQSGPGGGQPYGSTYGNGAGRGRGKGYIDEDSAERLSSGGSSLAKRNADGSHKTYHFSPCNCSVRTKVIPTTAFCPVCSDPVTQVFLEQNGKFTDFLAVDDAMDEDSTANKFQVPQPVVPVVPRISTPSPPPTHQRPLPAVVTNVTATPATAFDANSKSPMARDNGSPPSIMPRATVRRLPNPPKGPRPAPDHNSMDVDPPGDLDSPDQRTASPTHTRFTNSGQSEHDAQTYAFKHDDNLPFASRRPPVVPPHEARNSAASPTSSLDPFAQPPSAGDHGVETDDAMQDSPPPAPPVVPFVPPPPPPPLPPPRNYNSAPVASPQADLLDDPIEYEDHPLPTPVQPTPVPVPVPTAPAPSIPARPQPVKKQSIPGQWDDYEEDVPPPTSALRRNGAVTGNSAVPGRYAAANEILDSATPPMAGEGFAPLGITAGGFRRPEGGYELRGPRQAEYSTHRRNGSDGSYGAGGQGTEHLRAPSPLLPPQNPPPNSYLGPPGATPNGRITTAPTTNGSRSREPSRSRPVIVSEKPTDPTFGLSNLSFTPLNYPDPNTMVDKQYPTPEHLFQAMKFMNHKPLIAEHIRQCGGNPIPREEARRFTYEQDLKWASISVDKMYEVLQLKFANYPNLEAELLDTGEAEIILDSADMLWGRGTDGTGQNQYGKLLMRLREKLVERLSARVAGSGRGRR